jgi:hypothetical protein
VQALAGNADNAALAIAATLTPPLGVCPDRVWPGFPGREIQVLLADFRGRRALLWNDLREGFRGEPRLSPLPYEDLPPLFTSGSEYQFGELYGKATLGFAYDPKADPSWSAEVVAHEAFHRYVQGTWSVAGAGMARGIRYPEPWGPRYLRRELIRSLRDAAEGNPGALADAAAWQARLAEEFPESVRETRKVDVAEGTAEYAGVMAAAVAEAGCGAKESALIGAAARRARGRWERPDKEEESYALGVLAGLSLRARDAKGWEAAAASGTPPAEFLLAGIPPADPAGDLDLAAETKREVAATNRAVLEKIGPFLTPPAGDEFLVAMPSGWMQGSFETAGFVTLPEEGGPGRTFVLDITAAFVSPSYGSRLMLSGLTVETTGSPCGEGAFHVFPLPIGALREEPDGRGTIASMRVRGGNLAYDFVRRAGVVWLCVR